MNGIRASGFESLTIARNGIISVGYAGIMLTESAETDAPRQQVGRLQFGSASRALSMAGR